MTAKKYSFSTPQDRYDVCGEILESVKNAKVMLKMKHVRRYLIVYSLYDNYGNQVCTGNATKNWSLMKDEIAQVKVGSIIVDCIEEYKYRF